MFYVLSGAKILILDMETRDKRKKKGRLRYYVLKSHILHIRAIFFLFILTVKQNFSHWLEQLLNMSH